jgi:hypothetical protein
MEQMDSRQRRILLASVVELKEAMQLAQLTAQSIWLKDLQRLYLERKARLENGRLYTEPGGFGVESDSE